MKRRWFTILCFGSFALFALVCGVWGWTAWTSRPFGVMYFGHAGRGWELDAAGGTAAASVVIVNLPEGYPRSDWRWFLGQGGPEIFQHVILLQNLADSEAFERGVGNFRIQKTHDYLFHWPGPWQAYSYAVSVPCWFLALMTAILPGFRVIGLIRNRRRSAADGCAVCGYDLRATPGRCPECGAVPKATHPSRGR